MDAFYQYFLLPIIRNGWFNPLNSIVYGIILVAGGYGVFRLLLLLKIQIDGKLYISLIPFIAFAGVTRTLRDYVYSMSNTQAGFFGTFAEHMHIMQQNAYDYVLGMTGNHFLAAADSHVIAWFPTPGSYFVTFALALISLLVALAVQKYAEAPYWKTLFILGLAMFILNGAMLPVNTLEPLFYIGAVSLAWAALFFGMVRLNGTKLLKKADKRIREAMKTVFTNRNSAILSAHLFDATATFFAIAAFSTMGGSGYTEQHFLSRMLMPFIGPQVMFLLKLVVVIPVLYFLNKYIEDKDFRNFLLLVVLILGLAPASRNLARLLVGV
ncbi:MAG: DUF63 family protein [Candidatus Aenigmarchaeota archaeon]|nr:DUF63 family protein [Candidatus Aenigmarchaeota archaeon]